MLKWYEFIQTAEAQGVKADDEVSEIILNEKDTPETLKVYRTSDGAVEIW